MKPPIEISEIQIKLEECLLKGRVTDAVDLLAEWILKNHVSTILRNEVISLKERHIRLDRLEREDLIPENTLWIRRNRITKQILSIKDELSFEMESHFSKL